MKAKQLKSGERSPNLPRGKQVKPVTNAGKMRTPKKTKNCS